MSGLVKFKKTISYLLILVTLFFSALCTSDMSYVSGADVTETQLASSSASVETEISGASYSNKYSVVSISKFYLRKSAAKSSDKVKLINKDTVLYVMKNCTGNWVQVKDSTGAEGYAPNKELNYAAGTSAIIKCQTTDVVNLRKGKGTTYEVITAVPKSATLTVKANNNADWIKVTYKSNTGYISKEYAKIIVEIPSSDSSKTEDKGTESAPIILKYTSATIYKDCYFQINATNNTKESIKWSSSNTKIATVTENGIVYGKEKGTATIKAKISTKTISCTVKVINKSVSVNISNKTYSANREKTIYLTSTTKGVSWSSSDTSVATVKDGLVLCKKKGKAVIRAKVSGGWATCLVTVKGREAVRFTYANPNSAPLNSQIIFIAITDKIRTDVKFKVSIGSTNYTVKASSKTSDGDTYIWKGTKKLTKSGAYKVIAYSKYGNSWLKSTGSYGSVFVSSVEDNTTTSCEERHASNKIISFISNYEGFLSQAMYDPLTNFPCLTVGYGRVIYAGETFYNNMTKNEAFAYLVDSVESDGYVSKVNRFLLDKKIKFNQHQFDSLVSFVYNCGTGTLSGDSDLQYLFDNTHPSSEDKPTKGKTSGKCYLKKTASADAENVKTLKSGTKLTLLSASLKNKNYYYVKDSSGKKGYISYKDLTVTSYNSSGTRNLNNTIKKNYIDNFLCYHHAGGVCYAGLLYRRIDECEIFYYNEYTRDGEQNKNDFYFRCHTVNPNFGCG